jgi:hypothetical protein
VEQAVHLELQVSLDLVELLLKTDGFGKLLLLEPLAISTAATVI